MSDPQQSRMIKILTIDDEPSLLKIMGKFLSKLNYQPELAENSIRGLAILKADSNFDGVILDNSLPERPCHETIEEIKKINPAIKIILSTGHSVEALVADQGLQVDGTLQKPFTLTDFQELLASIF